MTHRGVITGLLAGGLIAGGTLVAAPASAHSALVALSPSLLVQPVSASASPMPVMVHGATLADAQRAVAVTGMRQITTFGEIGVVVARATKQQIAAARSHLA